MVSLWNIITTYNFPNAPLKPIVDFEMENYSSYDIIRGEEETVLAGPQSSREIVWMSWSFLFPVSLSELDKKEIYN